jgi:uncharacterized protein YlxW (UPF0749 family)
MPEDRPATGRERLVAALRRPVSRGQVTAAVLLAVVGFAATVQVRDESRQDQYSGTRQEDLIALLDSLSAASQRAENQIAELQETRTSLLDNTERRAAALEQAREQVTVLSILAGTVPAVGPGVAVTVQDTRSSVRSGQLLNGLEELRDAGAEAIEVNESVRVVASTHLRDGPAGIVVDGRPLDAPYTIEAIGDPDTLASALSFTGGFTDDIEQGAATVRIEERDEIEISTVRRPAPTRYADPLPRG